MKMTKVPFSTKYKKVLEEANDYIKEVKEWRERQRALGLISEATDDDEDRDNAKFCFVSKQTLDALADAKKRL